MKFQGLMLLRDEADVIAQSLEHLLSWIDHLYILDLGSTDETWDIVQEFAGRDRRIVPFETRPIVYQDSLRCVLFSQFRDRFKNGDWILKIDADEFYDVLPPTFVAERVRRGETSVWLGWYLFRLTTQEVSAYESGGMDVLTDRERPIEDRRRYYNIPEYAEPRMFVYRDTMQWPLSVSFPFNAGYVARERIPIRHYPHRDPLQMEKRYALRSAMMKLKASAGPHWRLNDWRRDLVDLEAPNTLTPSIEPEGLAAAPGHAAGQVRKWEYGTALPPIEGSAHLMDWPKRSVQRIIHPLLLPFLDRVRPTSREPFDLQLIPDEITRALS